MATLYAKDFVDHDCWMYLWEQAQDAGVVPEGSFDEGETDVDPDVVGLEVKIEGRA